jgi:hypothetical protein
MQGLLDIDMAALEASARYEDGFSAEHPLIREFWEIAHAFTQQERRQLLEFVTASDRAPVGGFGSSQFIIQRNGPDSDVRCYLLHPGGGCSELNADMTMTSSAFLQV